MSALGERVATVETRLDTIDEKLEHLHSCVEGVKKQVWMATGALALLTLLINLFMKGH